MKHILQETPVLFAHLSRFFERTRTFGIKTSKVLLNICDVGLEVASDEISKFSKRFRVTWNEWNGWRIAGFSDGWRGRRKPQSYYTQPPVTAQPEVQKSHKNLKIFDMHAYWMRTHSVAAHV